jgi:hypothetical protein
MATKRKEQLFKAWLKYQQKSTAWGLDDLANQTTPHGDDVYRITARTSYARVTYNVDRIAVASELQTLK